MSLDDQLKAALDHEAEMRAVPRPDIDGLISGGRVRRRRRNTARLAAVAAVVVLLGGAAYGVTQIGLASPRTDPGISEQPSGSATPQSYDDAASGRLAPGTYRKMVGRDATDTAIEADLTFEGPGWRSTGQPVVSETGTWAGLGVLEPGNLAGEPSGCTTDSWDDHSRTPAGTPQALGQQLTQLPRSTVVQPLTTTEAFGQDAVHLRLRVNADCPPDQFYLVAEAPGDFGITWSDSPTRVVIDFWVLDVDATVIMVASWHETGASRALVDEVAEVRDSITFVTDDS